VRAKGTRKRKAEGSDSGLMSARALLERIGQEEEKDEPRLTAREQAYVERAKAAQEMQERAFDRPTLTQAGMMLASLRGAGPLMVKRFREGGDVIEEDELAAFNRMLKKQDDDARTDRYFQELNEAMAETIRDFRFGRAQAEDVQRFFPGHSEWDIHRRFGDTDEETNLTFPSGPPSFKRLEEFEPAPHQEIDDFGPEGRYRREKVLGARRGGEVSTEDFIRKRQAGSPEEGEVIDPNEEMASGFAGGREPGKAEELFRAMVEGGQGFLGLEPGRRGSEAYRTGQALSNLPALALPAAAIKGTGKAKDALKALGKKETPAVDFARVFDEVDKLPTNQYIDDIRSAHIGGVGNFGEGDAKYLFYRVPGGEKYIKQSQQVAKKNLGNQFMGYRLMSRDEFEELQSGAVGDLLSFSLDRNAAEALRNFVKNQNRKDLVVAQVPLTPKHVVAFGSPGEKEIIVDTAQGWSMDDFKLADPVKKAEAKEPKAPEIKKSGKLTEVEKELLQRGGERQAKRLQRAADEIPGLEDQYQSNALIRAFLGRKGYPYQGVMTMKPGDFEEFALPLDFPLSQYSKENIENLRNVLAQGGSFDDVPFLMIDRKNNIPFIANHEGRHRTRALRAEGQPKTLVEVYPRSGLEMGADDMPMKATEWLEKFNEALGEGRLVVPEDIVELYDPATVVDMFKKRFALPLPEVYAQGGEVSTTDFIRKREKGSPPEGEVPTDDYIQQMMVGTIPQDRQRNPGILPPEIRGAVDVPLDFLNLLIRGGAGAVAGPAYGLYKGVTGGKYGTPEGVKEASSEAGEMMARITGEPKTQTARDTLEFIGKKAEEYKLAPTPQLLTLPVPGPGAASALLRNYELAQTAPAGTVKLPGGNWLAGQVEQFVFPLKKEVENTTLPQFAGEPDVTKIPERNAALNKFIDTGLTRYIKNDMASAKDTLRALADENVLKASKAYEAEMKQVQKAFDRAEKIRAEGPRPGMPAGTWENAIDAQLGRAQRMADEAKEKVDFELRHALPFPVLNNEGDLTASFQGRLAFGGRPTAISRRKAVGQEPEGIAQTAVGKAWEDMADLFVKPETAGQITAPNYFMRERDAERTLTKNPWLTSVSPETPVYVPQDVYRTKSSSLLDSFSADDLGFKHLTDELRNAMDPESGLPANLLLTPEEVASMGMDKAARHVIEINKWRDMNRAAANALLAQKSVSTYKQYETVPETGTPNTRGLQWMELKLQDNPDTQLPENWTVKQDQLGGRNVFYVVNDKGRMSLRVPVLMFKIAPNRRLP
jgi:hypothetical protein